MLLEYFQMIDRVEAIEKDKGTIHAIATVPKESPVFEGHFPGLPLVPGVLLIETMAQASGYMILATTQFSHMPFLVGVKQGKLRKFVEPETVLDVYAEIDHNGSGFSVTKASIKSNGELICNSSLTFKLVEFENEEFKDMIKARTKEIGINE